MTTLKNIIGLLFLTVFISACKNETTPEIKTVEVETSTEEVTSFDPNATYAKAEFTIEGMTCAMGCAKTIEKKMAKMEGVKSATVDFEKKLAMVEYDEAKVNATSLKEVVKKAGDMYSVTDMHTVDNFGENADAEKKACDKDCKKDCCKDKAEASETSADKKMACKEDCKMACCADKGKA
ncbi:heavy metal-associated domain-containing protein [Xanthomarina sp. F1114]|uniref:heavy-metal-associated domain-containing protein n=1 Tax=Xanthomarina sp. F1114 TaxID=2996019 RepID=UPI00225E3703|nr:heavy metal-associated domain-containing protein [Xanthomarina sp. F1114]MCX7547049.1 heavy metal-associated domain-containing protein [Xanthomarina sp. F1114]